MLIRENGGQHKRRIELTADRQNEHLLANGRSSPCTRSPGTGSQPLEPVGNNAAGLHAAAACIEIDLDDDAGADQIAQ